VPTRLLRSSKLEIHSNDKQQTMTLRVIRVGTTRLGQ
jgi:hypothetical protein